MSFFFSCTEPYIYISVALTHQTLHFYPYSLYPEGFYKGICSYIICFIIYNILIPQKIAKIVISVRSKHFLNYGVTKMRYPKFSL